MDQIGISKTIEHIFRELVAIPSVTQTVGERNIENHLLDWFGARTYFRDHPHDYGREEIPRDSFGRAAVWALVRGKTDRTVVLLNHHDTVGISDYGSLAPYATTPDKLMSMLAQTEMPVDAQADLASGKWLFGRGSADMKSGAAIQMALVQAFSRQPDFPGNLLFLSVPGEETISQGMLTSVGLLDRLTAEHHLDLRLLIDSEPHVRGPGGEGVVYTGSAGKLLALVYARGKAAHVGNVFAGLNPLLLMSEIIRQTELNPAFSDSAGNQTAPPPTWMFAGDRQQVYEGTIPHAAGGCLSVISLQANPSQILHQLTECVREACRSAMHMLGQRHQTYRAKGIGTELNPTLAVGVRTFADIFRSAAEDGGTVFLKDYGRTLETLQERIDSHRLTLIEGTHLLIEKVLDHVPERSPLVIIAFAPPYYPHASNSNFQDLADPLATMSAEIDAYARRRWNEPYQELNYFMQISDMSFASFHDTADARATIGTNMPLWNRYYADVFRQEASLSMPVINIGPWGKDLHKFTERVYKPDLLERTYGIIEHAIGIVWR